MAVLRRAALLALVWAGACSFEPVLGEGALACGPAGECPPEQRCHTDHHCWRAPPAPASPVADAAIAPDLARVPDLSSPPDCGKGKGNKDPDSSPPGCR